MIKIADQYIAPAAVIAIKPYPFDINWSVVVFAGGHEMSVNAPPAVVADRIALAAVCSDANCKEDHDA